MLVNFKVSNFLSFEQEQIFSMEAGKARTHSERVLINKKMKLLKFMAVYGSNASGKSNMIAALDFVKSIITEGLSSDCSDYYCRLSEENASRPSSFEFTIEINGKCYRYGFSIILKTLSFQTEWLHELTYGKNYHIIFDRKISGGRYTVCNYFKDKGLNDRLMIYADDIKNDDSVLFLSLMNQNKATLYESFSEARIYQDVFKWFKYKLSVNSPDSPITNYTLVNEETVSQISHLLSEFSTNVSEFKLVDIPIEKVMGSVQKNLIKKVTERLMEHKKHSIENANATNPTIMLRNPYDNSMFIFELNQDGEIIAKTSQFSHFNTDAIFSSNEESDGTIRLLDLIEILLSDDSEKVYVIDEINRRFHPLLTYKFVEEYLKLAESRNIQLIVTTHESRIMDLNLLRKDEISFINKDETGRSEIYSLDNFNERFDKKIRTAYLRGDYGAIPKFNIKTEE